MEVWTVVWSARGTFACARTWIVICDELERVLARPGAPQVSRGAAGAGVLVGVEIVGHRLRRFGRINEQHEDGLAIRLGLGRHEWDIWVDECGGAADGCGLGALWVGAEWGLGAGYGGWAETAAASREGGGVGARRRARTGVFFINRAGTLYVGLNLREARRQHTQTLLLLGSAGPLAFCAGRGRA